MDGGWESFYLRIIFQGADVSCRYYTRNEMEVRSETRQFLIYRDLFSNSRLGSFNSAASRIHSYMLGGVRKKGDHGRGHNS